MIGGIEMNSEINAFINKYVKEIRNNNAAFFAGAGFSKESGYVDWKRVLRICRKKKIQSFIKHRYNCCTKPASDPAYVAENILNREFKSDMINQKWVTDVSEFKYGVGEDDKKGKLYLSVILDLCDRRPVAFVYSTRNDTSLVFDTFDKAVAANPGATPLLHSDRGY